MENNIKKLSILEKPEIRNQETRIRVLMYGGQNTGKTYLTKIITRYLDAYTIDAKRLSGCFNHFAYDGAENCDAILIDDVPITIGLENLDFLKSVLQNPEKRCYKDLTNLSFQSIFVTTNLHFSEFFPEDEDLSDYFDYAIHFEDQNTFYDCCKEFNIPITFL